MDLTSNTPAPAWQVERWFNTPDDITLESLRGKVVVLEAFQMLCPGCVSHGLPQATRVHSTFSREQVAVIGLHTVFEHHQAMTPVALEAFLTNTAFTSPSAWTAPAPMDASREPWRPMPCAARRR